MRRKSKFAAAEWQGTGISLTPMPFKLVNPSEGDELIEKEKSERSNVVNKKMIASKLVKLAKKISALEEDIAPVIDTRIKRTEPGVSNIVSKLIDASDGDMKKMLTIFVMAAKKAGKIQTGDVSKLVTALQQVLRKVS